MEWFQWAALLLIGVIGVSVVTNQITFAIFLVILGLVAIGIFYFLNRPKKHVKAVEKFREEIMTRATNFNNQLGYLYLSGGKDAARLYSKRILGQIKGWTKLEIPDKHKSIATTLYVFRYKPRGVGILATIASFIMALPILNMFTHDRLFAVTDSQLGDNSLTSGDVIILGTATDTTSIFETLNTPDLDKDLIMGAITQESKRITLEDILNDLPEIVGTAIGGDSEHSKIIEALHGTVKDYGIKRD